MAKLLIPTILLMVSIVGSGCNQSQSMREQNALLQQENQTLRSQLDDRNAALESASKELRDRDVELAEMQQGMADMEDLTIAAVEMTGFEGIAGVSGSMTAGEITASLESDVLFSPGKTALKGDSKRTLDRVAEVLTVTYSGKLIRIAGHTDSDPIKKSGYKSNYHLGFERAYAVREYLISRGIAEDQISVASHGPDQPLGSKQASRRVEVVVVMN